MLTVGCAADTAEAVTLDNALKALALGPSSYIKEYIVTEEIDGDDITSLVLAILKS